MIKSIFVPGINLFNVFMFQVVVGGRRGGQTDERDEAEVQVQQQSGEVRESGVVQHVAAPGPPGHLQESWLEGGRLRDQDSSCQVRMN